MNTSIQNWVEGFLKYYTYANNLLLFLQWCQSSDESDLDFVV